MCIGGGVGACVLLCVGGCGVGVSPTSRPGSHQRGSTPEGEVPSSMVQGPLSWWAALSRLQWPAGVETPVIETGGSTPQTCRRKKVRSVNHTHTFLPLGSALRLAVIALERASDISTLSSTFICVLGVVGVLVASMVEKKKRNIMCMRRSLGWPGN